MHIKGIACGENHTIALAEMAIIEDSLNTAEESNENVTDDEITPPTPPTNIPALSSQESETIHEIPNYPQNKLFVWGSNDKKQLGMSLEQ